MPQPMFVFLAAASGRYIAFVALPAVPIDGPTVAAAVEGMSCIASSLAWPSMSILSTLICPNLQSFAATCGFRAAEGCGGGRCNVRRRCCASLRMTMFRSSWTSVGLSAPQSMTLLSVLGRGVDGGLRGRAGGFRRRSHGNVEGSRGCDGSLSKMLEFLLGSQIVPWREYQLSSSIPESDRGVL